MLNLDPAQARNVLVKARVALAEAGQARDGRCASAAAPSIAVP